MKMGAKDLELAFQKIVENRVEKPPQFVRDLPKLTGGKRKGWFHAREALLKSPINEKSIHLIESAIFHLILDDESDIR